MMNIPQNSQEIRNFARGGSYYEDGFIQPTTQTTVDINDINEYANNIGRNVDSFVVSNNNQFSNDPFYRAIRDESLKLFGDSSLAVPSIDGDNASIFICESGRPHTGVDNTINSRDYFTAQAKHFDYSPIEYGANKKAPHNVIWVVGEESLYDWERISTMDRVDRSKLFGSLLSVVEKDVEFISEATKNETVQVTLSVGYSEGFTAQSKETAHVHVLGKRNQEPNISRTRIDKIADKRKFLAQIAYSRNMLEQADSVFEVVRDSVQRDTAFGEVSMKINDSSTNIFAPLVFEVETLSGTGLEDVFELTSELYAQSSVIWDELANSGYKHLVQHPSVPSFVVGCDYNVKGRISSLRIIPSLNGYVVPEVGAQLSVVEN